MREVFLPGSIKVYERGCFLLWFHGLSNLLASTRTERLRLVNQPDGVYFDADLPDTQLGHDLIELITLNEVQGVSPGFHINEQRMVYGEDYQTRQIIEATLGEISLTHIPAYVTTNVQLRNEGESVNEELKQIAERRGYMAALRSGEMNRITSRY